MSILGWIILGGLAGWIGTMIMGSSARLGIIGNIVLGVVGAIVGGFAFNFFGGASITGFNLYSLGVAIAGSVIVLTIARLMR